MGQVVQFPRQRRRHQRIAVYQPVALVHANATVVTGVAVNLSIAGMQVLCDRYTADSLHRSDEPFGDGRGTEIDAHLRLPLGPGTVRIDVIGQLVYANQIAPSTYLIGVEINEFEGESRRYLEQFLAEAELFAG